MSAGSDAHGSFNFTNTDDFGGFGNIHDNAVGKLTTVTYCPNGMGDRGEHVLEAMYKGHTTLSDGPLITIGVSNNAVPLDNEVLMGDDAVINTLLLEDYHFNLNYTTTQEYGDIHSLTLIVGTENGEVSKAINVSDVNGDHKLNYALKSIIDSIYGAPIVEDQYIYVRAELQTSVTGLTLDVHRRTYDRYWSFSNPIWLKFTEVPLPEEFKISAYPNPMTDELNILVENPIKGEVTIDFYDSQGKFLKSFTESVIERQVITYSQSDLRFPKGNYLISGKMGESKSSTKLIKQ